MTPSGAGAETDVEAEAGDAGVRHPFGRLEDGREATRYVLRAAGISASVCDYGATLVSLDVPDRAGTVGGVVLGFDDVTGYETRSNNPFMGATVGRIANRIAGARFTLDGVEYSLHANEGRNHLHGGRQTSFDRALWTVVAAPGEHIVLEHVSPDGDGGYPATLRVRAEYRVTPSALHLTYRAWADRRTPVNMTQHAYFNLAGEGGSTVRDHELRVAAAAWTPVDAELLPTGAVEDVSGTPFDLRAGRTLGEGIVALQEVGLADGYDHNLWLDDAAGALRDVAVLADPASGRTMVLATDQPCLQVYTGNRLGRAVGRGDVTFPVHGAVCLEPQYAPDSINRPGWPSIVLDPGTTYEHRTVYRLTTEEATPDPARPRPT